MKKFLALMVAEIDESVPLEDELIKGIIEPVFENGKQFSGSVLVEGFVRDDIGESTLSELLTDHLKWYSEFVSTRKIEFRNVSVQDQTEKVFRKAS